MRTFTAFLTVVLLTVALAAPAIAGQGPPAAAPQGGRGVAAPQGRAGGPQPPATARAAAPVDLAGTWVSVVSEDWRWRMITPPKGDFANIPLNAEGVKIGEAWDPERDEKAGEACRGYAAPAIMREPGRLRISWQDDSTLKVEADAGTQTRLFHFAGTPPVAGTARTWQGYSAAKWEQPPVGGFGRGGLFGLGTGPRAGLQGRSLEVVTTEVRPGYLRKNGVPFGPNLSMTEYFDVFREPNEGPRWFVVTTVVRDPQYLNRVWVTSSNFKQEPNDSKWNPTPCSAR
jgi:hypothetical protein